MKNPSPLSKLIYYANDKGMDRLEREFKSGLNEINRDHTKEYSEEEKVIYFFPQKYDAEKDLLRYDREVESVPHSFDDHVNKEINKYYRRYLNWLRVLFETQEDKDRILSIIVDHKQRIRKLLNSINDEKNLPRIALKKIAYQLADYYQKLDTGETLEEQREKVTKTKIYKRYWELRHRPPKMRADEAYRSIFTWLTETLQFSEEEVKKQTGVNLEKINFLRNSNNQDEIKNTILAKYSDE